MLAYIDICKYDNHISVCVKSIYILQQLLFGIIAIISQPQECYLQRPPSRRSPFSGEGFCL